MLPNVFAERLYGRSHILAQSNNLPELIPGQGLIFQSSGIPDAPNSGSLYYQSHGNSPIELGAGSIIGASNQGSGTGVFKQDTMGVLQFKSLVSGTGISISSSANEITISGTWGAMGYELLEISDGVNPNPDLQITEFNLNQAGNILLTLGSPLNSAPGVRKEIFISNVLSGSSLTLLIPAMVGGSGLYFTLLGQSAELVQVSEGRWAISNSGADLIP